jgi:hypothetical protein
MSKIPLITVIILSYNTKEITLKCLRKLKLSINNLNKPIEVIVVENGTDGTNSVIKKKFRWVKLIEPKVNTGFARGNNFAIKKANKNSKYFLFLNSDAIVRKETLMESVDFMVKRKDCDVLGCKLILGNGKMQPSAGYLPEPFSVFTWIWGIDLIPYINSFIKQVHPKDSKFFSTSKKVGWVMGAYLFMKREVVEKTYGFDDKFFMYMEEVEWCKRINDKGFSICYTPEFSITHLDKSSSKKYPEKMKKIFVNELLGIIYFLKRYYPDKVWVLRPLIKIGLQIRLFAFNMLGNTLRSSAYREVLASM